MTVKPFEIKGKVDWDYILSEPRKVCPDCPELESVGQYEKIKLVRCEAHKKVHQVTKAHEKL